MHRFPNGHSATPAAELDDPRVVEAVQEYLLALEAGRPADRDAFLRTHADIADALADCLDGLDFVTAAATGLQTAGEDSSSGEVAEQLRGTPLGDFRIIREIGRGGMGIVYEAEQLSLGRRVALKVLPFASVLNPRHLKRFKQEAQAAAHLHHTNIVPVHGVGCERGIHYYAMQFIEGRSLAQVIQEWRALRPKNQEESASQLERLHEPVAPSTASPMNRITEKSGTEATRYRLAAQWGVQAAEALAYAHGEGIIHRDIKPANLLVDAQGRLWITDFGLARLPDDAALTMSGDILGTFRYMSPEQALGRTGSLDRRTDIYALGATLYELLTLEPAIPGVEREEILRRLTRDEPIPPRRHDRGVPQELETIVLKAIAKEPDARYHTAQDFADDLARFLEDKPIHARRPTLFQRMTKWTRRHRSVVRIAAAFLLLALIGLTAGLIVLWRQKEQTTLALRAEADERHRAEQNWRLALEAQEKTAAALQAEALERQRAEQNWRLALQSLDANYLQIAERQFFRDPQREREDRQTLQQVLEFYDRFIEANGAHRPVRHETAKAYLRVGEIHQRLGRAKKAEDALRRSVTLLEELHAEAKESEIYRRDLGASMNRLGVILGDSGRLVEAEETLDTTLRHRNALANAANADPDRRHELAMTWNAQALVFHRAGRHDAAEAAWREALSLEAALSSELPDILRYQSELSSTKHNLASLKLSLGQFQEAEPLLRETLDHRRQLTKASDLPLYRQKLALTHHNLGILLKMTSRSDQAEAEYLEAVAVGERLASEFPTVPDLRYDLAGYFDHLANTLTDLKRHADAERHYARSQTMMDALVAEFPAVPKYREMLAISLINQGIHWNATDRLVEATNAFTHAIDVCEQLIKERPEIGSYRRHLAEAQRNLAAVGKRKAP